MVGFDRNYQSSVAVLVRRIRIRPGRKQAANKTDIASLDDFKEFFVVGEKTCKKIEHQCIIPRPRPQRILTGGEKRTRF